jgi:precorrin-6A/cobalt-precorrin-6A reductase
MILLLGGTSDAQPLDRRLADVGYRVLVSQATHVPLSPPFPDGEGKRTPLAPAATPVNVVRASCPCDTENTGRMPVPQTIETRAGALDAFAMAALVEARSVRAIVDAGHPYADKLHATARAVAQRCGLPYLAFVRPGSVEAGAEGVQVVADHPTAAREAFQCGRPVLLTIGSKNLGEYVEQSRRTGLPLVARVLDWPASIAACRRAGIEPPQILAGRGPFSIEENRRQIRTFCIGVLVAKDSGRAGGTPEKLAAARAESCQLIVIRRPAWTGDNIFSAPEPLLEAIARLVPPHPPSPPRRGSG